MTIASPPPPVRDPVFQVSHLTLAYPARNGRPPARLLHDVSVEVERGGSLTLVGPSGAGKSTLLRCLNRLEEPPPGTVRFNGRDVTTLDPLDLRRRAALVMQTPVLFEGTVRDNLRVQPRAAELDLSDARLVTIARALLSEPEALLLDEPTSALDPVNAALVAGTIADLRDRRGLTIVAVTHQAELVRRLAGCFLYLVGGEAQVYECVTADHDALTDARLQAFLAGESPTAVAAR
jgi:putative ABC transport system ATP-binding protein